MKRVEKYYVFHVRITIKGECLYKKRLYKVMTKERMDKMQKKLAKQYEVDLWAVAFAFEDFAGLSQALRIALNEFKKICIM